MRRHLTPSEAAAALTRGAQIEQLLALEGGTVRHLVAFGTSGQFVVSEHHVFDDGHNGFRDISEFRPVDEEEDAGEGKIRKKFPSADKAVSAAEHFGGVRSAG